MGRVALFLCYVAFPLGALIARGFGSAYPRHWLDMAWLGLLIISALVTCAKRTLTPPAKILLVIGTCLALVAGAKSLLSTGTSEFLPIALEAKPIVFLIVSSFVIAASAPPSPRTWLQLGKALSILLSCDALITSLNAQFPARPYGSGEVNYDAFLLALALGMATLGGNKPPARDLALIGVALVLTQSRTVLAGTVLSYAIASRSALTKKIFVIAGGAAVLTLFFLVRDLDSSVESLDRYWMWVAGVSALRAPLVFWFGTVLGSPIEVDIPDAVATLWDLQTASLRTPGVYPFNLHAFWLRAAVSYGLPVVLALLGWLMLLAVRRSTTRPLRFVATLSVVSGSTMGLFYLSNVSVPLLLALAAAAPILRRAASAQGTTQDASTQQPSTRLHAGPAPSAGWTR